MVVWDHHITAAHQNNLPDHHTAKTPRAGPHLAPPRAQKGGANLLSVSKLLFRLSKTAANDAILLREGLCGGILKSLSKSRIQSITGGGSSEQGVKIGGVDLEAGIYLWGSLKVATPHTGPDSRALWMAQRACTSCRSSPNSPAEHDGRQQRKPGADAVLGRLLGPG